MKKEKIQHIANVMPNILKQFGSYIKDSFDKNGQDTIDDANGISGILIKLFAKDKIDGYFSKKSEKKLDNFGLETYLQASLLQVGKSLETISLEKDIENVDIIINSIKNIIENKIDTFDTNEILTVFQPKYHPLVVFIKDNMKELIQKLGFDTTVYNLFVKDFNENIENSIIDSFGSEDYTKHKEEVKQFILNEREAELLFDMYSLRKIGFKEDENLKYEETYGKWKNISGLLQVDNNYKEDNLVLVEELIEQYYNQKEKITLREIVFIIADFGKGKSVFLRHYASKLAKNYIETSEGYFPIYFNLRNFKNYQATTQCGVIADFLRKEYGIDITNDDFKNKKYMFLVDSLDESGELNKHSIEDVINSIKEIQNLDDSLTNRDNRIIITSRPFDDGLDVKIKEHLPRTDSKNNQYFISVYGFKENQFNDWIKSSLKDYLNSKEIDTNKFTKQIVDSVKSDKDINIHSLLIKNKTLTEEELKRPIFAYMIYQLIINNIDFSTIGKTGVYLSFLNLLTKEAKHIDDIEHEYNLKDEIESRNVLHAIAALWMYEKQQGKQGILKKSDIFRVLEGKKINEDDNKVLEEYKDSKVSDIKFLSHSYFGAKDDLLHFQHQSFAEMLLAEYYLKIFIKYALDDNVEIEEARVLLNLGEPTPQTVEFFKELLQLLKDSCDDNEKEKRKLLFPLLASLATEKHNKRIRCNSLYYKWLSDINLDNLTNIPNSLIDNWCIDSDKLYLIIKLSKNILESKNEYLTTKVNVNKALFDGEVVEIEGEKLSRIPHNIDKWMALLVGNILYNNKTDLQFFNSTIDTPEIFFDMMKDWSYIYDTATPQWAGRYFVGVDLRNSNKRIFVKNLTFENIDFSYSYFKNIDMSYCRLSDTQFNFCSFNNVDFYVVFHKTFFGNILALNNSIIRDLSNNYFSMILMSKFIPENLGIGENRKQYISSGMYYYSSDKEHDHEHDFGIDKLFDIVKGFLLYGLKESIFTVEEIINAYDYNSDETKELFSKKVKELENMVESN